MDLFFNALKGQFNSLNFFFILITIAFLLLQVKRKKAAKFVFIFAFIFFSATSTAYLPRHLITNMESKYVPFVGEPFPHRDTVFIQSLGGGYTADPRLEPTSQLSSVSLGRLAEAIRIARMFDKSILVVSGNIASGEESMASVSRKAAIQLGWEERRIVALETPATTQQEAIAFTDRFGKKVNLILVTDAIHMPRAMKFFREQGVTPFPAPTNYLIKKDKTLFSLGWIPSAENLQLMDRVWREYLGSIKGVFMNSKSEKIKL